MKYSALNTVFIFLIFLIIGLVFGACETAPKSLTEFDEADLMGVVYDGRARSVQDYAIVVDDLISISSDVNGRFTIPSLKNGTHHIKGTKLGYQSVVMDFDYQHRTQFLYLTSNALIDYLNDAELALAKKDYLLAQSNVSLALSIDAKNVMAMYLQALIANNLNDSVKAYQIIQDLIDLQVKDEAVYLLLLDIAKNNQELRPKILTSLQDNPAIMANPRLKNRINKLMPAPVPKENKP